MYVTIDDSFASDWNKPLALFHSVKFRLIKKNKED